MLMNIIVLLLEVLYYSLFMIFTRREGKAYRYFISFGIITTIGIFVNMRALISYFILIVLILLAMKYIVRSFLDKKFKRIPYIETYIGEFAENHPIGKYLITTNNHITACVDGYIIDTWDCTDKRIEYIWKI